MTAVCEERWFPRITAEQLWDLVWRPSVQRRWLGEGSVVSLHAHHRFSLNLGGSLWRTGRVLSVRPGELTAQLSVPGSAGDTELAVTIDAVRDVCRLHVVERGFGDEACRREAEIYWRDALHRLSTVVSAADCRIRSPRQAVIIIHGIGEQRPGRTLRDFVRAGTLGASTDVSVTPDRASSLFELRRVTLRSQPTSGLPTTDAFELYWAHLIRDTTTHQVLTWTRRLLLRRQVPAPLRPAWLTLYVVLVAAVVLLAAQFVVRSVWFSLSSALATVVVAGWRLFGRSFAVDWVGDAARYLAAEPGNIAHRQAIRQEGVDLLARLHEGGAYDRIVVVGHSLGSVIAYDILVHAWIRMHRAHRSPRSACFTATRALERAIGNPDIPAAQAQDLQHAAWEEQRRNTQPWLVTDLVTLGSPLTYGGFLLSESDDAFEAAKDDRVFPTCPPRTQTERRSRHERCSFETPYADANGRQRTFTVFDHGALFAVTRWTNLYFPARWGGLTGDLVGGPVQDAFGRWVLDVPLAPVRGFAHTSYWKPPGGRGHRAGPAQPFPGKPPRAGDRVAGLSGPGLHHLAALRLALAPWSRTDLLRLCRDLPRWLWSEAESDQG
ncbi:MAG: hypothetical protein ACXVFR_10110 [Nocardioidaceae bacterium]